MLLLFLILLIVKYVRQKKKYEDVALYLRKMYVGPERRLPSEKEDFSIHYRDPTAKSRDEVIAFEEGQDEQRQLDNYKPPRVKNNLFKF